MSDTFQLVRNMNILGYRSICVGFFLTILLVFGTIRKSFSCFVGGKQMGRRQDLSVDAVKLSVMVACEYGWWHRGCPFQKFPCGCLFDR